MFVRESSTVWTDGTYSDNSHVTETMSRTAVTMAGVIFVIET